MTKESAGCLVLGALLPGIAFGGYTVQHLWNWFVVPFFGAQTMSIYIGVGVDLILGYIRISINPSYSNLEDPTETLKRFFNLTFLSPAMILGVGYCVHRWGMLQ